MARPNKLERYAQNASSENVIEAEKAIYQTIAGNWNKTFFDADHPITLELACGKGEYTIGLARQFPQQNFIGIDLKGDRIWVGSQAAQSGNLRNVAFVRSRIELLPNIFKPDEISEMWLTFPDPRPKDRDEKHRLTNIFYINLYRSILKKDGWFKFKTDNTELFDYSLEVLNGIRGIQLEFTYDVYNSEMIRDHYGLKTKYEKIWSEKGEKIKYLRCKFD